MTDELPAPGMNQASPITLASLNLHGGVTSQGEPFDVAEACHRLKADVITLQEAWRPEEEPDVVTGVAAALGAEVRHRGLARNTSRARLGVGTDQGAGTWGLAVLTMLPVTGYQEIELGRAPGDRIGRAAQVLTLATPGGAALRVVNTHLTHRYSSPVQLALLVRRLAGSSPADRPRRRPQHAPPGHAGRQGLPLRGARPVLPGRAAADPARSHAAQRGGQRAERGGAGAGRLRSPADPGRG